jgi:hypothetical protein
MIKHVELDGVDELLGDTQLLPHKARGDWATENRTKAKRAN